MLSRDFSEVKKLRSAGNFASALPLVHSSKIESDEDAFEAMICLFVSGNLEAVLGRSAGTNGRAHGRATQARRLVGLIAHKDTREALSLARSAVSEPGVPYDAVALYLDSAARQQADRRGPWPTSGRDCRTRRPTRYFCHIAMAEIAAATGNSAGAYSLALSVLSRDMNNFRALLISSLASYELGNIHESLGYAIRPIGSRRRCRP